jgi:hypothetical protein
MHKPAPLSFRTIIADTTDPPVRHVLHRDYETRGQLLFLRPDKSSTGASFGIFSNTLSERESIFSVTPITLYRTKRRSMPAWKLRSHAALTMG